MILEQITDPKLAQYAYLVGCRQTGRALIIDPQRDIDRYIHIAKSRNLTIVAAADTHIHADYLSGLRQFAHRRGVMVYASGAGGDDWQYEWLRGSTHRHQLLGDGDSLQIGSVRLDAWHTPGHTPEHLSFFLTDLARDLEHPLGLISGDFVFVGDVGRPDLLERVAGQSGAMVKYARAQFQSLQAFKRLSSSLMLLPAHGAGSACGKSLGAVPVSTVGYELGSNPSLLAAADRDKFVDYILAGQPEPPPYFARMKRQNRDGPAILDGLPRPRSLPTPQIRAAVESGEYLFVDTRPWDQFRAGHLPGSIYAPLEKQFTGIVASYAEPHERICLIIEANRLREAVTDCIRVGLDKVEARIAPEQIRGYQKSGGRLSTFDQIDMRQFSGRLTGRGAFALDVRRAAELAETGTIGGAHHIAHTQLSIRHDELPRDREILVFCRTGNRSRFASGYLDRLGYRVTLADGGIEAWRALHGPQALVMVS